MMRHASRTLSLAVCLLAGFAAPLRAAEPTPEQARFFETKVRPVLAENCFKCHGEAKQSGGLRLDSPARLLRGGDRGPAVVPGEPGKSLLVEAINHDGLKMPPKTKLAKAHIQDLTAWVKMGAPWPGADKTAPPTKPSEFLITDKDRAHWSFQPVKRPAPPAVKNKERVSNPVDAFLLAKLEAKGLTFEPPAGKRELIRRAYFDLIGLPPTPEEVEAFVKDDAPDAWEKIIDRLLASPRYGERWGRHWLDVVRFAQTNGYERDAEKPFAWRYRDYVIRSFNDDKPYDRFVTEQLAGDELDPVTEETLIATGFYRLGVWDDEPDDPRQAEFDDLDEMLSTAGETFLGLTVGCARCHDHKFDPIGQDDYYGMLAFLRNIQPLKTKGVPKAILSAFTPGEQTLSVAEIGPEPAPTHVLIRGNAGTPGKQVEPRFLRVLCKDDAAATPSIPKAAEKQKTTGRRRVLARWIAGAEHPLTARVLVNRLWQHHFGRGFVATPNDFGRTGVAPTHPELLDWLASEFVAGGWRIKRMHKLIMLSDAYRQSSRVRNEKAVAADPDNALLWRQNLRRLEAEAIRDAVLAVNGRLNLKMGGRGVFPTLPPEVLSTQSRPGNGWDTSGPEEQARRSVYVFVKRTLAVPLLETFDFPSPDKSSAARATTTIAPQALILLNSAFMDEQAAAFADRLIKEGGADADKNLGRAFELALLRAPTAREKQIALDYLKRAEANAKGAKDEAAYRRALAGLCKLVLNLNEFVYID